MIIPAPQTEEGVGSSSTFRLKRGTKNAAISATNSVVPPLSSINGPFQLAEYLAFKVRHDPHDIRGLIEVPGLDGSPGGKSPEKDVWIYEHLRRIPIDITPLLVQLLTICTRGSCPQMKADEWLYLCVAHGGGGTEACCAIDYILHSLDSTTTLLNSTKQFPSRLQIPPASLSHFPSLFRRLSRIFSHAYYHHREAFSLAEAETSLYARFVALCEQYDLVGSALLVVPAKAYSSSPKDDEDDSDDSSEDEDTRGREKEGEAEGRRAHSLDRHPLPPVDFGTTKPALLAQTNALSSPEKIQPKSIMREGGAGKTIGLGTLRRGKQARGAMLWSSDAPVVPEKPVLEDKANDLERTESTETAIDLRSSEESLAADGETTKVGSEEDGPAEVPKDEIELLEEKGEIAPLSAVAPLNPADDLLKPSAATDGQRNPKDTGDDQQKAAPPEVRVEEDKTDVEGPRLEDRSGDEEDGLEEVKLEEEATSPIADKVDLPDEPS